MKRKSPSVENAKQGSSRKHRAAARNGNGNGNGHTENAHDAKVFADQPAIETLLGNAGGRRRSSELDKTKLLGALAALKKGDFSTRLPIDLDGVEGKIADTFNDVVELNQRMAEELERLSRVVGKEGKIAQRGRHWRSGRSVEAFGQVREQLDQRPGASD